jgi:(E)-4-hydroxy-3-methylbut-2-enyl-diphosphate synthase
MDDAIAFKEITEAVDVPVVADIHFDHRLALKVIENGVAKIRLNPGNIKDPEKVKLIVNKCKEYQIPIRIGVNAGSLSKEMIEKYGHPCKEAMIESAKGHIKILEDLDFHDIILSIKASDIKLCVESYRLAAETFEYPLHIGITESGTDFSGTIKSSAGLGILLFDGIGDTIRVSLSSDPVNEIKVCKELLSSFDLYSKPKLIACPTCGRCQLDMIDIAKAVEQYLETVDKDIKVAVMGCVVNGPGEAKEADIGIAGGKDKAILFKNGQRVRILDAENLLEDFISEIEKM